MMYESCLLLCYVHLMTNDLITKLPLILHTHHVTAYHNRHEAQAVQSQQYGLIKHMHD